MASSSLASERLARTVSGSSRSTEDFGTTDTVTEYRPLPSLLGRAPDAAPAIASTEQARRGAETGQCQNGKSSWQSPNADAGIKLSNDLDEFI